MNNDEVRLLRSIKKTAVVLLAMIKLNRPSGEEELSQLLEMSQETVRNYLRGLQHIGLVGKISRYQGWIITGIGSQLALPGMPEINGSAEFPRSQSLTTTTNLLIKDINKEVVVESESGSADSALNVKELSTAPVDNSVWKALKRAGISRNTRTEALAQMEHITPEYIDRHWRGLVKRRKGGETGLLISILESGQDAPEEDQIPYVKANKHPDGCGCEECRSLYKAWED